jgi:hypothetical protein
MAGDFFVLTLTYGMTITGSETQLTFQTKELVLTYQDVKDLFSDQGITVDDAEQVFRVILRKDLTGGQSRDILCGEFNPDQNIVFQFVESSGPSEVA